jgi:hydroxyacylglutathione hydrolase
VALFSGGTLLAGGVARPDLLSPEQTEPLARAAYRSIHERLLTLPDDLPVYPTHGGGSFCSAAPGGERTTTIGRERATNPLLADDPGRGHLRRPAARRLGSYPPYFLELRDVNRAGATVHGPPPPPPAAAVGRRSSTRPIADGAEVVDVRRSAAFAGRARARVAVEPVAGSSRPGSGWLVPRPAGRVRRRRHRRPGRPGVGGPDGRVRAARR